MTLKTNGFTLIELIIVIGLILVLALAGFYGYQGFVKSQKINLLKLTFLLYLKH